MKHLLCPLRCLVPINSKANPTPLTGLTNFIRILALSMHNRLLVSISAPMLSPSSFAFSSRRTSHMCPYYSPLTVPHQNSIHYATRVNRKNKLVVLFSSTALLYTSIIASIVCCFSIFVAHCSCLTFRKVINNA